jgi:hypothetical protein
MKRHYLVQYQFKPFLSPDDSQHLVKLFMERGVTAGTIAHYVRSDGRGGFMVMEQDGEEQATQGYENALAYQPYLELEMIPIGTIDDALPSILKMFG